MQNRLQTSVFTIANIITALRVLIVPVFFFLLIQDEQWSYLWALLLFGTAAVTDVVDGLVARRLGEISELGVFLDPLADKLLVLSALLGFVWLDILPLWMVVIVALRDVLATVLRVWSLSEGNVMYPSRIARWKTVAQMVFVVAVLTLLTAASWEELFPFSKWADDILRSQAMAVGMGVIVAMTLGSLLSYAGALRRLWQTNSN